MIAFLSALLFAAQPAAAPPAPCSEADSVRTTVVEIASEPDRFVDKCVTVTGAVAGIQMFSGQEGMYLTFRLGSDGNASPEGLRHRIGIDRQDIRNLRMAYPQQTTVTGRVDTCERRYERARAAGGIPFLGGYCHYHGGPTVVVDSYSITERRHERMIGESMRARFGNLGFMPDDWPTRRETEAAFAEFLAALRARDRARLAELHEFDDDSNEYQRNVLYDLTQSPYSVFREAREGRSGQIAYFVLSAEDGSLFGRERPGPAGYVCVCRTGDCSDRWPISVNDTSNVWDRPYACTHIEHRDYREAPVFVTEVDGGWLSEPAETAMPWPS